MEDPFRPFLRYGGGVFTPMPVPGSFWKKRPSHPNRAAETVAGKPGGMGWKGSQNPNRPGGILPTGTEGAGQPSSIFIFLQPSGNLCPSLWLQAFLFLGQVRFQQVQRGFKVFRREGVGPAVTTDLVPVQMEQDKHEMTGRFRRFQNPVPTFFNGPVGFRGGADLPRPCWLVVALTLQPFLGWLVFIDGRLLLPRCLLAGRCPILFNSHCCPFGFEVAVPSNVKR